MKQLIVDLARRSFTISQLGLCGEPAGFSHPDVSRFLSPATVLALDGDKAALSFFCRNLLSLARRDWGVRSFVVGGALGDMFSSRSVVECYKSLLHSHIINNDSMTVDERREVEMWFYRLALSRADGSIDKVPGFENWQNRNQGVPATMVYEVADLVTHSPLTSNLDGAPLWKWADANSVSWDLTWRSPDDAWLYQFIWTWSAYRQAALRRPELLHSENAQLSCDFYKKLWAPGGNALVFGESQTGDLLAAITSLTLGAHLFEDSEQKWIAKRFLLQAAERGDDQNLVDRGPEFHRIYTLWPEDLEATPPARHSMLLESPLAGRGWSLGGAPYDDTIKASNPRFPDHGISLCDYDPLYQEKNAALYAISKPDKLVFCEDSGNDALFALADLRAQGLHDHPDALGVVTLIGNGVPWLVESAYMPREVNRQRWLHNVPLYRRGHVSPEILRTYHSDTWREVAPGDAWLEKRDGIVMAQARIPRDAFDYLDWDGDLFDVERTFLFDPEGIFIVIDRLRAAEGGAATVSQAWHTPAHIELTENAAILSRDDKTCHASFAQSTLMHCDVTQHEAPQQDAYYFPGSVNDVLWHAQMELQEGEIITMGAVFSCDPMNLSLTQTGDVVQCGEIEIDLGAFGDNVKCNSTILLPSRS